MKREKTNNFYEFCEIIEKLRAPGGCPWDREQTHKTLAKHLIEEAYEAYDAILEGDMQKVADELGDVLLQIVMHSQIGKEEGTFTIDDVVECVSEKMITRHPHVFGEENVENSAQVLDNWEKIKKKERRQKTVSETMETVAMALPALTRAAKVIKKAADAKLYEMKNYDENITEQEIGKRIFSLCALAQKNGIDPEAALREETKIFIKKIKNIEENT